MTVICKYSCQKEVWFAMYKIKEQNNVAEIYKSLGLAYVFLSCLLENRLCIMTTYINQAASYS